MKKILYWIRFTFSFSETEARGFIVLMIVMALFIVAPFVYEASVYSEYDNYIADQRILDSVLLAYEGSKATPKTPIQTTSKLNLVLFSFNPNVASPALLGSLGLSDKVIRNIANYRNKGGRFKIKKDLAKIYSLSSAQYHQLKEYILLPDTLPVRKKEEKIYAPAKEKIALQLDLNTADSLQLRLLKGIGQKLSARIIKYRNALGGFVDKQQLKEVYGLDSLTLVEVQQHTFITPGFTPKQIFINDAKLSDFEHHPYLSRKKARILFNFITLHKPLSEMEDMAQIKIFTEADLIKLRPYLKFN